MQQTLRAVSYRGAWPVVVLAAAVVTAVAVVRFAPYLPAELVLAGLFALAALVALMAAFPPLAQRPFLAPFALAVLLVDFAGFRLVGYLLVTDLLLLLAGALWLRSGAARNSVGIPVTFWVFAGLFIGGSALSLWSTPQLGESLSILLHFSMLVGVLTPLLVTLFVHEPQARSLLFPAVLVAAFVHSGIVLAQVRGGLQWAYGDRINGIMDSEIQFLLTVGLIGCAVVVWSKRLSSAPWLAAALAAPVIAAALAITRFRAAWVAALVGGVVAVVLADHRKRLRALLLVSLAAVVLSLAYTYELFPGAIQERLTATFDAQAGDLRLRRESARDLLEVASTRPLVGIGYGQSFRYLPRQWVEGRVGSAHNIFINTAVEGGLLAAIGLVGLYALGLVYGWRALRAAPDVPYLSKRPLEEGNRLVDGAQNRGASKRALQEGYRPVNGARNGAPRAFQAWLFASYVGLLVAVQFIPTVYWRIFYMLLGANIASGLLARSGERVQQRGAS